MALSVVSALFVARRSLARENERHAAFGAIARMILNNIRVHRTGVGLFDAARRARFLQARRQVEVKTRGGADEYGQEQNAYQ
jgi:hypothetical protein